MKIVDWTKNEQLFYTHEEAIGYNLAERHIKWPTNVVPVAIVHLPERICWWTRFFFVHPPHVLIIYRLTLSNVVWASCSDRPCDMESNAELQKGMEERVL